MCSGLRRMHNLRCPRFAQKNISASAATVKPRGTKIAPQRHSREILAAPCGQNPGPLASYYAVHSPRNGRERAHRTALAFGRRDLRSPSRQTKASDAKVRCLLCVHEEPLKKIGLLFPLYAGPRRTPRSNAAEFPARAAGSTASADSCTATIPPSTHLQSRSNPQDKYTKPARSAMKPCGPYMAAASRLS